MEDYVSNSTSGAVMTIVCAVICLGLFISEYSLHRATTVNSELKVDTVGVHKELANAERLRVHVDITFHSLACELITLDTLDQAGEVHHDVHDGHIKKRRLDRLGNPIEEDFVVEEPNKHKELHDEMKKIIPADPAAADDAHSHSHGHGHGRKLQNSLMPLQGINFFNLQDLLNKEFPNGVENAFKNEKKEGCEVMGSPPAEF